MRARSSLPLAALWLWGCAQLVGVDDFAGTSAAGSGGATAAVTANGPSATGPDLPSSSAGPPISVGSTGAGMPGTKRIFVTSNPYPGTMATWGGANGICNKVATASVLGGKWYAWLATNGAGTDCNAGATFYRVDKTPVGTCAALKAGTLMNPINRTESGAMSNHAFAWTGAYSSGSPTAFDCGKSMAGAGTVGSTSAVDSRWSDTQDAQSCSSSYPLYCLEI